MSATRFSGRYTPNWVPLSRWRRHSLHKLNCCQSQSQSQSYITTDRRSASPSWCQAPIWDQRPIFPILSLIIIFFFFTISGLLMWSALSDEKSGLYFSVFAGHGQRSLSQIWVPWDSWAYFIVSIFETPPTWRTRFLYLFPPGSG
jgi:hypothetical protein